MFLDENGMFPVHKRDRLICLTASSAAPEALVTEDQIRY